MPEAALERIDALAASRAAGDDTPFMLGVGFVLPHCPFVARKEDYERFEGRVGLPTIPRADPASEHPWITRWREYAHIDHPSDAEVIRARTAYYGLVHALDRKIGRMLDRLDEAGLGENTIVVYASDHGEQIGERDLWWKNTFFDESAKVPLIASWPGVLPQGEHRRTIVNLIDVGATFIAAAGAPGLPRSRGRSLLDIAGDGQAPWLDETFCEYVTDLSSPWTGPEMLCQRMLRHGPLQVRAHGRLSAATFRSRGRSRWRSRSRRRSWLCRSATPVARSACSRAGIRRRFRKRGCAECEREGAPARVGQVDRSASTSS